MAVQTNNYNFILFENNKSNIYSESKISLTKTYTIGLLKKFYIDNNIDKFKYALLLYDPLKKTVAIVFTKNKQKGSFAVTHDKRGKGANISVKTFMKANNISPNTYYGSYDWKKYTIEGFGEGFIFELRKE